MRSCFLGVEKIPGAFRGPRTQKLVTDGSWQARWRHGRLFRRCFHCFAWELMAALVRYSLRVSSDAAAAVVELILEISLKFPIPPQRNKNNKSPTFELQDESVTCFSVSQLEISRFHYQFDLVTFRDENIRHALLAAYDILRWTGADVEHVSVLPARLLFTRVWHSSLLPLRPHDDPTLEVGAGPRGLHGMLFVLEVTVMNLEFLRRDVWRCLVIGKVDESGVYDLAWCCADEDGRKLPWKLSWNRTFEGLQQYFSIRGWWMEIVRVLCRRLSRCRWEEAGSVASQQHG